MSDLSSDIDTKNPDAARRYNAWLGGKDNFATDRNSANKIGDAFPAIKLAVAENRRCLLRTVRYLATDCGIRQFLDIGCGFPTQYDNVHQIAQQIAPDSRIVYVDTNHQVGAHTRALCTSTPQGAVAFSPGDLRQPGQILTADTVQDTLDLTRPVAVLLFAVLHFLPDTSQACTAVRELMARLPQGSYLGLSHATFDPLPDSVRAGLGAFTRPDSAHGPFRPRTRKQITGLLRGLHPIEPGVVSTVHWHPDLEPRADPSVGPAEAISYAALAVKP